MNGADLYEYYQRIGQASEQTTRANEYAQLLRTAHFTVGSERLFARLAAAEQTGTSDWPDLSDTY